MLSLRSPVALICTQESAAGSHTRETLLLTHPRDLSPSALRNLLCGCGVHGAAWTADFRLDRDWRGAETVMGRSLTLQLTNEVSGTPSCFAWFAKSIAMSELPSCTKPCKPSAMSGRRAFWISPCSPDCGQDCPSGSVWEAWILSQASIPCFDALAKALPQSSFTSPCLVLWTPLRTLVGQFNNPRITQMPCPSTAGLLHRRYQGLRGARVLPAASQGCSVFRRGYCRRIWVEAIKRKRSACMCPPAARLLQCAASLL
ncbi:hypothetical protein VTK26DRAFT_5447 [Humicola hyalothermophila]